jgi:hypothetical protein
MYMYMYVHVPPRVNHDLCQGWGWGLTLAVILRFFADRSLSKQSQYMSPIADYH